MVQLPLVAFTRLAWSRRVRTVEEPRDNGGCLGHHHRKKERGKKKVRGREKVRSTTQPKQYKKKPLCSFPPRLLNSSYHQHPPPQSTSLKVSPSQQPPPLLPSPTTTTQVLPFKMKTSMITIAFAALTSFAVAAPAAAADAKNAMDPKYT